MGIVMGLGFIALAVIVLIGFLYIPIKQSRSCKEKISATIEEIVDGNMIVNGEPKHSAICKYYYQGVEYNEKVQFNTEKNKLRIGSTKTIFINTEDPTENYVRGANSFTMIIFPIFVCSVFIVVGAFIVYTELTSPIMNSGQEDVMVENSQGEDDALNVGDSSQNSDDGKNNADSSNGEAADTSKTPVGGNGAGDNQNNDTGNETEQVQKVNIFKVDKATTLKLRQSPYYVQVYKDIKADPQYKGYGSDMTNDIINGDSNYMAITTLDKNMKEMMIYIPQDMKYVTKVGYNYYYKSSFDDSWLRIYIAPHKGNDVFARQMLNDMANYNKIFGSVNIPVKWNNNAFVTFDARNANGDYLDVACSVNKKYMVYIEYKHEISGDNTFAQMISTIKY